ncbi:hypothetical protein ACFQJC_04815 [Haloferax namakaokahaiae]|uniref:Uncharacterized protein n=1 Tax=Haloferax namakaokahaiae TaxID=1748331 RepID=A0ABD5ZCE1_9EURY
MQRVILGLANDDVADDRQHVPEQLDPAKRPAIECSEVTYLDGASLYHGKAYSHIDTVIEDVSVTEKGIVTERLEEREPQLTEFIADPSNGWVGVDSSNGDWFYHTLMGVWGTSIHRCNIDVTAFADHVTNQREGKCWQVGYKDDLDDDDEDGQSKAGTVFHRDAHFGTGSGQYNQFGYSYLWDGVFMRGTVAQSGYVAEFNIDTPEVFARWLGEEILPFCSVDESPQTRLEDVR